MSHGTHDTTPLKNTAGSDSKTERLGQNKSH